MSDPKIKPWMVSASDEAGYAEYPTDHLLIAWADIKAAREAGDGCDNLAPGTCCNYCNQRMIAAVLSERLGAAVTI